MKGTIVCCLQELVVEKFGKDKWEKSLEDAGLSKTTKFLSIAEVDDATIMKVVQAVCKNLKITLQQAADAFGEYWVTVYSQRLYSPFYAKHKTAKNFLLDMDNVHVVMTQTIKDARPPRFVYEWEDDRTLIMHYQSDRGLIDFLVGLIKGVGVFYRENLTVAKIGTTKVRIVFP